MNRGAAGFGRVNEIVNAGISARATVSGAEPGM
jgi:hypothetical protein